jgi:DMSO/TMAO reductase YedYZ heme-binding membrane subunit
VSLITGCWALWYSIYRAYYGFGGSVGMLGTPVSESQWRTINLVAAVSLLLLLAVLPIAVLPLWKRPRMRVLLGLCWVLAVGFVMHGVIDDLQRVLSLTRLPTPRLPVLCNRGQACRRYSGPSFQRDLVF